MSVIAELYNSLEMQNSVLTDVHPFFTLCPGYILPSFAWYTPLQLLSY